MVRMAGIRYTRESTHTNVHIQVFLFVA